MKFFPGKPLVTEGNRMAHPRAHPVDSCLLVEQSGREEAPSAWAGPVEYMKCTRIYTHICMVHPRLEVC
jgi:hypothetical protein